MSNGSDNKELTGTVNKRGFDSCAYRSKSGKTTCGALRYYHDQQVRRHKFVEPEPTLTEVEILRNERDGFATQPATEATEATEAKPSGHFSDEVINKGSFPEHIARDGTAHYRDGTVIKPPATGAKCVLCGHDNAVNGKCANESRNAPGVVCGCHCQFPTGEEAVRAEGMYVDYETDPVTGEVFTVQKIGPAVAEGAEMQTAKGIVGTLFHNSDGDMDTLERVMIERIAEWLAENPARQPTTDSVPKMDENLMRFMEHFIVKIDPFYERKYGKVPPEKSGAWELLAFVQNEMQRHSTDSVAEKARRAAERLDRNGYIDKHWMQKSLELPDPIGSVARVIIQSLTAAPGEVES
jgi:hypothetical protein